MPVRRGGATVDRMDTAALVITLVGYPVALCVFAFLIFVVVRAAMRSALREHRALLTAELRRLQAPARRAPDEASVRPLGVKAPETAGESGTATAA